MKITQTACKIKLDLVMDVSVDVAKDKLDFFFTAGNKEYQDQCQNRTAIIEKRLAKYLEIAKEHGWQNLRVICEPTGQYQNSLLRTSRRLGCLTSIVNTESVAKFRLIETNDSGKTDIKDPRVIHSLGQLNKVLRHRILGEQYLMLRRLGAMYEDTDSAIISVRCRLDRLLVELFCDYSFKKDFLYEDSGMALLEHFGCNPYKIIEGGLENFRAIMTKSVPYIRRGTIERLWQDATSSVLNEMPAGYIEVLEMELYHLYEDFLRLDERKEKITGELVATLEALREKEPNIPPPTPGVISAKNLARLLGETGPLGDFCHWRMLMRYAGLNIRMRQSGTFQGLNKISKKGRTLLRKVLSQIVLPLIKKTGLYGEYYHRKKQEGNMPGTKAMTVVMRHFLRKFYGWFKSARAFDRERFFTGETMYQQAA